METTFHICAFKEATFRKCAYIEALPYMHIYGSHLHICGLCICTYTKLVDFHICLFNEVASFLICIFTEATFLKCAYTKATFRICTYTEVTFRKCSLCICACTKVVEFHIDTLYRSGWLPCISIYGTSFVYVHLWKLTISC
jgi:hypothetical protein